MSNAQSYAQSYELCHVYFLPNGKTENYHSKSITTLSTKKLTQWLQQQHYSAPSAWGGGISETYFADIFSAFTCDELPYFCVYSLPQQAEQGGNTTRVPHSNFVFVHSFAINKVPQSSTGVPLDLQHFVVQKVYQMFDSSQPTHLNATTWIRLNVVFLK